MGQAEKQIPRLRRLFMGTLHPRNRCTAAYNMAAAFLNLEDFDSAMEWAERSGELAKNIDEPSLTAGVHNQQASLSLRFSRFEEAETGFNLALDAMKSLGESFQAALAGCVELRNHILAGFCASLRETNVMAWRYFQRSEVLETLMHAEEATGEVVSESRAMRNVEKQIAELGHGGLCRNCKVCQYPICNFGK